MSHTKIGCETYIVRDGKLLLGKRGKAAYGSGTWALPGGHLELMERADETLIRELKEEMNITVSPEDLQLIALTDDVNHEAGSHYVHITFAVDVGDAEPELMEPESCEKWRWFLVEALPENIFPPHKPIFATIQSGSTYRKK